MVLLLGICTWLMFSPAAVADFTAGLEAYERSDFETARAEWTLAAEQGDARAQYRLGQLYERGEGGPKDESQAGKWYRRAAEQGHVDAQAVLGYLYMVGQKIPRDDAQAVHWLQLAAEHGNPSAQEYLSDMYVAGRGVTKNDAEAVRWMRAAAEQGRGTAQLELAIWYLHGSHGLPKDVVQEFLWHALAAEPHKRDDEAEAAASAVGKRVLEWKRSGHELETGALNLSELAQPMVRYDNEGIWQTAALNVVLLVKRMTPEQLLAAQKLFKEWKPKNWKQLEETGK